MAIVRRVKTCLSRRQSISLHEEREAMLRMSFCSVHVGFRIRGHVGFFMPYLPRS
jgi:hypothetical protein